MKKNAIAIILAAGKGSRMKSDLPKAMIPVFGKPLINYTLETLESMEIKKIITVISKNGDLIKQIVSPYQTCVQNEQLGTGHAVLCTENLLQGCDSPILVILGDVPFISKETYEKAINLVESGYNVVALGYHSDDPKHNGRLKIIDNKLLEIVEFKDATEEEKQITFCNSGCMVFDGKYLFEILHKLQNNNTAKEYYLTDAIKIANDMKLKCTAVEGSKEEMFSANTPEELEQLKKYHLQNM